MKQSLGRSVLSNTLYNYLGQLLITPLTFVISVYMVRKLNVDEYGTLRVLTSLGTYVALLSFLGIPSALLRYVPEFYALKNYRALQTIVVRSLLLRFSVALGILVIVGFAIEYLASVLQVPGIVVLYPLFALGILMRVEHDILNAVLQSLLAQRYVNLAKIVYTLVRLVVLFAMLEAGLELMGVVIAFVLSDFALLILYVLKVSQEIFTKRSAADSEPGDDFWKRALKYAGYNGLSGIGTLVTDSSLDIYLVSAFLGASSTGLYSFAFDASSRFLAFLPATLLTSVLVVAVLQRYAQTKSHDDLRFAYFFSNKIIVFSTLPVVVGGCLLAPEIISNVFDEKYLPAVATFVLFMIFGGMKSLAYSLHVVIAALEKANVLFYSRLIALTYNLILDLLLIPRWGIIGAAFATGSAYVLIYFTQLLFIGKYIELRFPWRATGIAVVGSAVMALVILLSRPMISNLWGLLWVVLLGGGVYLIVVLLNAKDVLVERERAILRAALPSRLKWLVATVLERRLS